MPLSYIRSANRRKQRRRYIRKTRTGGFTYRKRGQWPFAGRNLVPTRQMVLCKRVSCGRLMTQYGTSASAGATCTWNSANNVLTLTTPATGGSHYFAIACAFALDDIPSITDFTALFDLYKINAVKFKLLPYYDNAPSATNAGGYGSIAGFIHHVQDDDDIVTPTASDVGIDEIRQYLNYRTQSLQSKRPISRYIRPRISIAGGASGAFTAGVNMRPKWINCAYTNATHYGFKAIIEIFNSSAYASTLIFKIEPTYYLGFKNMR